jgi:cytochrome c-type biogenesis protein CcmH
MIWIFLALMTAAAVFAVLWPLLRKPDGAAALGGSDVAVYRDQLEEIERDCATGIIAAPEAEAARIEVSRRLIAAADAAGIAEPAPGRAARRARSRGAAQRAARQRDDAQSRRRRLAAAITLVGLPLGAAGLYLVLGSPDLTGQPLAERVATGSEAVEAAFARVEAHLEQDPEDGRGWEVIAPVYMRVGRYQDAVKARSNALRLLGSSAQREADLGEALVAAANGIVTTDAKAAFDEAIRLDPTDVSARFYQGLAAEQDGNPTEAARLWRALLADAPQNAPWSSSVSRALARVEPGTGEKAPSKAAGQAGDVPAGQDQMIRGMVERLAARLREDGADVDGWLRLVRSYTVLGDAERERAATADARAALANDPEKLRRLDAGLRDLAAGAAAPPASSTPDVKNATTATIPPEHEPMTMVERLAARLQRDGSDLDGWLMLVRSYKVLGETDRARAAAVDARRALAGEADKLRGFEEGVKKLGVDGFE